MLDNQQLLPPVLPGSDRDKAHIITNILGQRKGQVSLQTPFQCDLCSVQVRSNREVVEHIDGRIGTAVARYHEALVAETQNGRLDRPFEYGGSIPLDDKLEEQHVKDLYDMSAYVASASTKNIAIMEAIPQNLVRLATDAYSLVVRAAARFPSSTTYAALALFSFLTLQKISMDDRPSTQRKLEGQMARRFMALLNGDL